ncbi:unnamed protein product [Adineta ricciae]|uniref:Uncharacterized protein n=1 Tax=Adineta ricciae TaxID=249248 RepID=A0A814TC83_ADIRI|nr:unnamed protein product [Adineta ricciae]
MLTKYYSDFLRTNSHLLMCLYKQISIIPKSIEQELAEAIQANANLSQQFQQQQHEFQQERQQLGQRIEILPQQL